MPRPIRLAIAAAGVLLGAASTPPPASHGWERRQQERREVERLDRERWLQGRPDTHGRLPPPGLRPFRPDASPAQGIELPIR